MSSPGPERRAIEELWLQRVKDAKLRLDGARMSLREVVNSEMDEIFHPDGYMTYQKAVRAENAALRDYALVLRVLTDLTVNGVIPDETEWRKRKSANAGASK